MRAASLAGTGPAYRMTLALTMTYATRRSALALAQCRAFVRELKDANASLALDELQVVTSGDRIQDRPLAELGGKRLFVKEIEEALLDGRADFAVHSMKDVPSSLPTRLVIGCVPRRADARDVLVAPRHGSLDALPEGARVGTSSMRRAVALLRRRPDLRIESLRGNVDTRLRKLDEGQCDAIVLAAAGLARLGLQDRATERLSADTCLPAPGQGALGIECREDDDRVREVLRRVHDVETAALVAAERGVLAGLGGDCRTPLGAYAERDGATMRLRAFMAREDGTEWRAVERSIAWPTPNEAYEEGHALGMALRR